VFHLAYRMGSLFARWNPPRLVRHLLIFAFDALIAAASYWAAMWMRFEFRSIPAEYARVLVSSLPILLAIRFVVGLAARLHRWSFRMSGLHEAIRLLAAMGTATVGFTAVIFFAPWAGQPPRSVIALEFFFTTGLMAAYRFGPRLAAGWYVDHALSLKRDAHRTLIIGAGGAGDLLLRDLERSENHNYRAIGFVDDDLRKVGTSLGGKPVFGTIADLPKLVARHRVSKVLIAVPRLSGERVRQILSLCAGQKVAFKIIPSSPTTMDERVTAAMLDDLSPEDLLPRDPVSFDPSEIAAHVRGKRVMVTGGAGSIGSEIARQIAACAPERLVLVDMNENELYFLARRLQVLHPGVKLDAQIADIREAEKVLKLGEVYRPHFVFHAAAHKHVPLMEDAPEEAVKNNVFGTQNVARMADACGAERFVLISTDKAVRPTSVMGATKRVAELVVRDLARTSKTHFTAVRFGNVLGSAGSVVPLFKEQIERGGPVTVTHPDCTRYFMTIPEAVGLVLIAGLSGYGELCILDMGQAIRIADLASNLITMAGYVPGKDIQIQFTGLRPGEKLAEELMTEEEETTRQVRNKIQVAKSPPPPEDLARRLEALRRAAHSADRAALVLALQAIVASYQPTAEGRPLEAAVAALAPALRVVQGGVA
jgi:FlaA1/EpsC-like NDP-sugar epimerase